MLVMTTKHDHRHRDRSLSTLHPSLTSPGLTIVLALAAATFASAAETTEPGGWTPELSMSLPTVTDTAISDDGASVAFVVRRARMEDEVSEYVSQIWVQKEDGEARRYTAHEASSSHPRFSPDGRFLAFLSSRKSASSTDDESHDQVWMMRLDGGEPWRLTNEPTGISSFEISPDGRRLAFLRADDKTEAEKQADKEKRSVVVVDQNHKPSHVYVIDLPESPSDPPVDALRLTSGDAHFTAIDWAPDSSWLAVRHQADPTINTGTTGGDLSRLELPEAGDSGDPGKTADTDDHETGHGVGTLVALVTRPGQEDAPRVSPDGQLVAFGSDGGRAERIGLADLFVVPSRGGEPRALAHTPDRNASLVGWTSDSRSLIVQEAHRTERALFLVPVDGGPAERLAGAAGVVGSSAIARSSTDLVLTRQTLTEPIEVYRSRVDGRALSELRRVSALAEDLELPALARTEVLQWTSPDGTPVEGLLTYPTNYRAGNAVPAILNVHGGPAGVFSQSFTGNASIYMIETFAAAGYAVLRPNPRGSTGYGKDFRYANIRDWGYGDYEDLIAGVDLLVERGIADAERLFVMGWSYGGYMTSFVVTRTDRFKAASMGAGLPNLVSMVHTTDIPDYLTAHMGGELWEGMATYQKHSAMFRLDQVTTPTQILHGERDLRVPLSQGQELYTGLKRLGVPTEMAIYPRTPHGPREPRLLMDVTPRILDWFERFMPTQTSAPRTAAGQ